MDTPISYGTLYVVATPIGNLEDMTFRAVSILKQVDLIAAEDTRHSKRLLDHYGIDTRMISCHEHNEADKIPLFIAHLKNGLSLALISDAGTPTVSDPGYPLVRAAAKESIPVLPIPGCSAVIAGLSVSGLPTDTFYFSGFPPKKTGKLKQALESLKDQKATLIFYESPRRIKILIQTLIQILGDRQACLTREVSKIHEEYLRGNLSEILEILDGKEVIKGECSLFVQGCGPGEVRIDEETLEKIILDRLAATDLATSELSRQIAEKTGLPKKRIYDMILKLSPSGPGR
nr:16S rRNA (cytidine(1402)-2'-O)-methyltransferase [Desulfobacula sp.]